MSCCTVKATSPISKELDVLKKMFDEVVIEKRERYQVLTLRDVARKPNYDYVVWLQLKIQLGYSNKNTHTLRSDEDMLKGVLKPLLDWIDRLKGFEKFSQPKQVNLFGESENELEPEPESPKNGEERAWGGYFKKYNEVRKRNLMKKYTFFELFHPSSYLYSEIDYRKKLPTLEEARELYKRAILRGKDNSGRYDDFWWDYPQYITEADGLSDIELKARLHFIRVFLIPYWEYPYISPDLSYSEHKAGGDTYYRYYLDGTKLSTSGPHDNDKMELPSYENLFDTEFLKWVRETLDVPYKEPISDKEILKENLNHFFNSLLWYERKNYDWLTKINTVKNWKQFKADIMSFLKDKGIECNGGGSGYSIDGFSGHVLLDKKGEIRVEQDCQIRQKLNRNLDLEINDYNRYVVHKLVGDEIYKKAFELFNKKEVTNKVSLFDFAA